MMQPQPPTFGGPQRVGPYGRALPNVPGMLSMRIPGQFGLGYGVFGMPGMNPLGGPAQALSGMQAGRFGQPQAVNQGPGAQRAQPLSPFEGQRGPNTLARLRMLGKKMA